MGEFKFLKDVNNLTDMKKKIKTCDFWADTWAISTLERLYNIKIVIFSSENYKKDEGSVMLCGQINNPKELVGYNPKHYIVVDHTGQHYLLITFNNRKIFTIKTLPK